LQTDDEIQEHQPAMVFLSYLRTDDIYTLLRGTTVFACLFLV